MSASDEEKPGASALSSPGDEVGETPWLAHQPAFVASREPMAVFTRGAEGAMLLCESNPACAARVPRARGMTVEAFARALGLSSDRIPWLDGETVKTRVAPPATPAGGPDTVSSPLEHHRDDVSAVPVLGPDGAQGVLVVVHGHVDRQLTAAALRESEEKLAKAFRASPGAMAINELRTGIFVEINDGYTEAFGYTREQLIGRSAEELGLWRDLEDQRRFVKQLREAGSVRDFEALGITKSGETITCIINAELGDIGGISCLISSLRDVTHQRRVEAERAALESRLRQVQKLEALGTLAGGIAHDFNNILTTILSGVELALLDREEPPLVVEHLGEVRRASERARDLVKQVLAFSRRQPAVRKSLRLEPIVEEVVTASRTTFAPGVSVEVRLGEDVPSVLGDSSQLHRVLTNVTTNASQALAGRAGRVAIHLDAVLVDEAWSARQPELRPGRYARVSVEDTGQGMTDETLKHIFDPFFTTREHGGMGLGLAVVHGIVRDHDGAVNVQSQVGQGTRFEIFLPEHLGALAAPDAASPAGGPSRGQRQSILLVDDEPLVCRGLQSILERLDYQVTGFNNPLEARSAYEAAPLRFDLVLTDLTMPKLTGIDLAKAIFAVRPGARVLLMTGFSVSWTPEKVKALGLRDLLWKPISLEELASAVRRALSDESTVAA